ncbi:hypothetical protein NIES2111_11130 [Nostoc sp. NIES-2111]|nr:hypothetical protein NIES2111_11130 [Nostoc sp. NIES-2111]
MSYGNFGKVFKRLIQSFQFILSKLTERNKIRKPIFLLVAVVSLLLSGCVEYDVGVNFNNSNSGQLVQRIKLGEQLTSFSGDYVYEWLNSIERRARKLEGTAKRISREEVVVTIPFSNGRELQTKFNEFFNSGRQQTTETGVAGNSELPKIESNLFVVQNNFLLVERNELIFDLDLRSLSLIASRGNVLADAGAILDLEFGVKTPWGAKNIQRVETAPQPENKGGQLVWQLQPGELNHIEVVFWLPSPLGIGALLITLFVLGGIYLRYTFMPNPQLQLATKPSVTE